MKTEGSRNDALAAVSKRVPEELVADPHAAFARRQVRQEEDVRFVPLRARFQRNRFHSFPQPSKPVRALQRPVAFVYGLTLLVGDLVAL